MLWNQLQSIVSQKTVLQTIFKHRGWNTSGLIGSHCCIVIFSWETLVAKQLRNGRKFKAFMVIRRTWLETCRTLAVKGFWLESKVFFFLWIFHEFGCLVTSVAGWENCGVWGPLITFACPEHKAWTSTIRELLLVILSFLIFAFKLRSEIFTQIKHCCRLKLAQCWERALHT